ncbi:hypothetical protein O0I10_007062 [Lichtheimia ornata]|uniref:Major facilitator superfamily (MFS) profile domain-containing protein n=1 Tax=Lichtheimia ornata TaxID=688661 RepID=A0AAD7XY76_9FUNG|nr:uncharacterized protein O0I10_007062 [Lichtheimia ornata]KAJ8657246.1 hypothetical protein O0I10_007062 [Lichtheimia ornata]
MESTTKPPLPYRQLIPIFIARLTNPLGVAVIYPFLVPMVKQLSGHSDQEHVGYYTGLMSAAPGIGLIIGSIPWGALSDYIGRRKVLLMSFMGPIIGCLLLGLCRSIWWAIAARGIFGFLDNSLGVIISMLAEITKNNTEDQRAMVMSLTSIGYGVGICVGPLVGSFLMDPVNQYPGLFHHDGQIKTFLVTYPFFLPCFSIVLYSLFAGFITFFFVEETMEDTKKHQHNEEPATFIEETRVKRYSTFESPHKHTMQRQLPRQNMIQFDCSIFQRMRLALTPPVAHAISKSFLAVCAYLAFEVLFIVYATCEIPLGGLGFDPVEIAAAMSYLGMIKTFSLAIVVPFLVRCFGSVRLVWIVFIILSLCYTLLGMVHYFDVMDTPMVNYAVWISLIGLLTPIASLSSSTMTVSIVLVNNAARKNSPSLLGTTNGLEQFAVQCGRVVGSTAPTLFWGMFQDASWIPSSSRSTFPWGVLAIFNIAIAIWGVRMNPKDYEDNDTQSKNAANGCQRDNNNA